MPTAGAPGTTRGTAAAEAADTSVATVAAVAYQQPAAAPVAAGAAGATALPGQTHTADAAAATRPGDRGAAEGAGVSGLPTVTAVGPAGTSNTAVAPTAGDCSGRRQLLTLRRVGVPAATAATAVDASATWLTGCAIAGGEISGLVGETIVAGSAGQVRVGG
ncbi:hypothetical protein IWGMT90018_05390 [Mycobacterium kiyosense]|nr:hypothetical protein IWGMT90018_05390 [Mycobacterium kiyosense]